IGFVAQCQKLETCSQSVSQYVRIIVVAQIYPEKTIYSLERGLGAAYTSAGQLCRQYSRHGSKARLHAFCQCSIASDLVIARHLRIGNAQRIDDARMIQPEYFRRSDRRRE